MSRIAVSALTLCCCLAGSSSFGQSALVELYGEGVHQFYAGDLLTAQQTFTDVIARGSEDPRVYYFRGLTSECMGASGQDDIETAARLEAEGKQAYDVGLALTRIQGQTRAAIEKARLEARIVAQQNELALQRARVEARESMPAPVPPAAVPPATRPAPSTPATDPFSADEGLRSTDTTPDAVQPAAPEVDALTNPFGDDTTAPAAPTTPAAEPPATDPFGGAACSSSPAATDPFGGTPAPRPLQRILLAVRPLPLQTIPSATSHIFDRMLLCAMRDFYGTLPWYHRIRRFDVCMGGFALEPLSELQSAGKPCPQVGPLKLRYYPNPTRQRGILTLIYVLADASGYEKRWENALCATSKGGSPAR